MNRPKYLIIHHTGGVDSDPMADTSRHTFATVDNWHRQLWNWKSSLGHYIGYHYFIDINGQVTQGRADNEAGAHCIGKNTESIGICLAGNFDHTPKPSDMQVIALRKLLVELINKHDIKLENVVPHRKFSNKTCYGRKLADDWAQSLIEPAPSDGLRAYDTIELINELKRRIAEGDL